MLSSYDQYFLCLLSEGKLYSGTVADLQAKDPLIMESEQRIRTEQHDSNMLSGRYSIMKTCPLQKLAHAIYSDFFSAEKIGNFIGFFKTFFLVLLKT